MEGISTISPDNFAVLFPVSREIVPISGENQFVAYLNTANFLFEH